MKRHIVYLTEDEAITTVETSSITTSAFFLSHDLRRDVRLYLTTADYTILLDGSTIRLLRPDAQSTLGLLKKVIRTREGGGGKLMPKGFSLLNQTEEKLLIHLPNALLCYPAQKGRTLPEVEFEGHDPALIVGTDRGKTLEIARASEALPIRLSRGLPPPNHDVVLFNILLDRMGMIDGDSSVRRTTPR